MNETTHREYLLWVAYFNDEWNQVTKNDWYLAQIAREVACVLEGTEGKKQKTVKSYLLKFNLLKPRKTTEEESTVQQSKNIWKTAINNARRIVKKRSVNG